MTWAKASRQERGYGAAWDKVRKVVMARDKWLCRPCMALGRYTTATQCDHVIPKAKGGTDAKGNLQAICAPCHDAKTIMDNGGEVRPRLTLGAGPAMFGATAGRRYAGPTGLRTNIYFDTE